MRSDYAMLTDNFVRPDNNFKTSKEFLKCILTFADAQVELQTEP